MENLSDKLRKNINESKITNKLPDGVAYTGEKKNNRRIS